MLRLAYDDGETCVSFTETTEVIFYSMANVMQHEREAFNVGALTNAATGEHVVIFVNGNRVAVMEYNRTSI